MDPRSNQRRTCRWALVTGLAITVLTAGACSDSEDEPESSGPETCGFLDPKDYYENDVYVAEELDEYHSQSYLFTPSAGDALKDSCLIYDETNNVGTIAISYRVIELDGDERVAEVRDDARALGASDGDDAFASVASGVDDLWVVDRDYRIQALALKGSLVVEAAVEDVGHFESYEAQLADVLTALLENG